MILAKMRVQGTEAESFVLSPSNNRNMPTKKKPVSIGEHIQQQLAPTNSNHQVLSWYILTLEFLAVFYFALLHCIYT